MQVRAILLVGVAAGVLAVAAACGRDVARLPFASNSPTPTPFGDGHDGPREISGTTVVNACVPASGSGSTLVLGSGSSSASSEFVAGRLVLVVEMQDAAATADASSAALASIGNAGAAELVRIDDVVGASATLSSSLSRTYVDDSTAHAQVCTIPEYTDVTLHATGRIVPAAWDGRAGGVVAFFASGTLTVDGEIDASGAGFRAGATSTAGGTTATNVTAADTSPDAGGGKGEGLAPGRFGGYGRGNASTGAGGGNSYNGGGGGGGNAGAGGRGGTGESEDPLTAGMAGVAILPQGAAVRLLAGGGGGGGQQNNDAAGVGGAGGGIVLVRASRLEGAGAFRANGAPGTSSGAPSAPVDGAGGGGAGGTLVLEAGSASFDGTIEARGGAGGNLIQTAGNNGRGPGGGGGGGAIFLAVPSFAGADAGGAPSGSDLNNEGTNGSFHATAGANGVVDSAGNLSL